MIDIFNSLSLKDSDNFEEIIEKIKTANSYSDELQNLIADLTSSKDKLWFKAITQNQLLANTDWTLVSSFNSIPNLKYSGDESLTNKLLLGQEFTQFLSFKLEDKIEFDFQKDKRNITVYFYDADYLLPFVKSNNINISSNSIFDQIRTLRSDIFKHEKICHEFGLKE